MAGDDINIKCPDGTFVAYLTTPPARNGPGVVVVQEAFGVNHVMREICDDLALTGYIALCPDLFWRQEPRIQLTDQTDQEWQRAFQLFEGFDVDKGVADLEVALAHLRTTQGCSGSVGGVGFCLGGLLAYLLATRIDIDCSVSYYGVNINALPDEAPRIGKPLMLHVAEEDAFVPKDAQSAVRQGLGGSRHVTILASTTRSPAAAAATTTRKWRHSPTSARPTFLLFIFTRQPPFAAHCPAPRGRGAS